MFGKKFLLAIFFLWAAVGSYAVNQNSSSTNQSTQNTEDYVQKLLQVSSIGYCWLSLYPDLKESMVTGQWSGMAQVILSRALVSYALYAGTRSFSQGMFITLGGILGTAVADRYGFLGLMPKSGH